MTVKVQTKKYVRFEVSQSPTFEELRDAVEQFEKTVSQVFIGEQKAEKRVLVMGSTAPNMLEMPSLILEAVGDY